MRDVNYVNELFLFSFIKTHWSYLYTEWIFFTYVWFCNIIIGYQVVFQILTILKTYGIFKKTTYVNIATSFV